ncbi:MAG: ammonium transporter [Gammaproteobacteria bacterium]
MTIRAWRLPAWLGASFAAPVACAAAETTINGADTAWVLTSTALVLFMTIPGLSLFYGGLVRTKNALSILMQCFAITCVVSLAWALIGYGLAFGDGGTLQAYIGSGRWLLDGVTAQSVHPRFPNIPESVFLAYQMTFAIITPALIVGGFAERMRFPAMLAFSVLWLVVVYLPVCHWVWGGGWLGTRGLLDFAGGTVVHVNAGVAALVAALMIGSRHGFPNHAMPPHNMPLVVTGAAMLWVGWFGFNAGSALGANGSAGMALLVTHLAAASGSLAWMAVEWVKFGKPSVLGIVTGMVAGLGTITPGSGYVGPLGAITIGLTAGVVCFFATQYMKRVLRVDDSLDVFPVHGVGGILGTTLTGVFASQALGGVGLAEGVGIGQQVTTQVIGVLASGLWSAAWTFVLLKAIDVTIGLRVSREQETQGLDVADHNESGYNL